MGATTGLLFSCILEKSESLPRIISCMGPFALFLTHRPSRAPYIQPLIICFPL